ncbi:MAG TPA: VOC family protein, partial [Candidatus Binataceae bacterium]
RPSHEKDASHDRYHPGLHHLAFKAHAREDVDEFHRFLLREHLPVLDPPKEYPEYGETYYAVFFTDPDGMKLELAHFPWGYWRRAQIDSADDRPRYQRKSS